MNQDIIQMITEAKEGNEEAFNQLFQTYYGKAYGIAWSQTRNDADAKDAVQEAFLTIHASFQDLREIEHFHAWMRMIVISKCHKIFRKKHDVPSDPVVISASLQKEYRSYMDPQEYVSYRSEQDVLYDLILKLKPKYRDVIELVYLKQMKIEEAANVLHISAGTVKTRIHRAKKDLLIEIKAFERENHRKLDFRSSTLASALTTTSLMSLTTVRMSLNKVKTMISHNALTSACAASMSALIVTGGVFAYQDAHVPVAEEAVREISQIDSPVKQNGKQNGQIIKENQFPKVEYLDQTITTGKDAYYVCVNFALDEAEMQTKSKEDLYKLHKVYQTLKSSENEYWKRLYEEGWANLYEQAIQDNV